MNARRFFDVFAGTHPPSAGFREAFEEELKRVSFPKGYYLVQAHTPAFHLYYLEDGFAVSYCYTGGKRVVTNFWQPGEVIVSPVSFFRQVPTDEIIQLTVNSDLQLLPHPSFINLSNRFPLTNALARDLTIGCYERYEYWLLDIHALTTWARYEKLVTRFPGIELKVSQELIASYLNITPQSLSRLKSGRRG